jgi:MAF protein
VRLVLASASPRRRELLTALGYDFEVVPSSVDEDAVTRSRPERLARALALAKAREVAASQPDAAVLAADTVVVRRGVCLAKPSGPPEARDMLQRLRGRPHHVITAVCVVAPRHRPRAGHEVTRVVMRPYMPAEVEASIARGDPFDKAGAYAIQDPIFRPVATYQGCYCNVVGLPLWTTLRLLLAAGAAPARTARMPVACEACATNPQGQPD